MAGKRRYGTRAGGYVAKEMRHRKTKPGTHRSRKQAIAIGLSRARHAGLKIPTKKA